VATIGADTHFDFVRVTYDVDRAGNGIEASDLPKEFGAYLRTGGA
jgi:hypothetical protein